MPTKGANLQFDLVNPITSEMITSRNQLLQKTMRPSPPLFPISSEYPIVLDAANNQYSFCLSQGGSVIAHANLWPRHVINKNGQRDTTIGLIGNVATDPQLQGQGIMTKLMEKIHERAIDLGLSHLLLWSDLDSFYQKRGFASLGGEVRLFFDRSAFPGNSLGKRFTVLDAKSCNDDALAGFLQRRPKLVQTLARTVGEFRRQLSIPGTHLIFDCQQTTNFGVMGKGYDMGGIIHEWGCNAPSELEDMIAWACQSFGLEEVGLLVPQQLERVWVSALEQKSARKEEWPMALARSLTNSSKDLSQLFVWGLDAI